MIRELFIHYSRIYFLPNDLEFLAKGLIYGDDTELSDAMKKLFQGLGLSHFTAASGANLRLLFPDWLMRLSILRWKGFALIWEVCGVFLYLKMAMFSPSLWRASLFWFFAWVAKIGGRKIPSLVLFFDVLLLTAIIKREYFGFLGFQLSFLCMFSLYFSQITMVREKRFREYVSSSPFIGIRESFRESLYVFVFLAPLLYYKFQTIAPTGVLGTMMASPVLQVFTQLSLASSVFRNVSFLETLRLGLYEVTGFLFFVLWFVDTSVFKVFVWAFVLFGILVLLLQLHRGRAVWRELQ